MTPRTHLPAAGLLAIGIPALLITVVWMLAAAPPQTPAASRYQEKASLSPPQGAALVSSRSPENLQAQGTAPSAPRVQVPGAAAGALGARGGDLGRAIYLSRCATCHGESGKGDGPAAMTLNPRPRDFTSGVYAYRTTESGSIPTDEDLIRTIREGLPGTAMPAWGKFIAGDSLAAILAYIKGFSSRFQEEKPRIVKVGAAVPASPAGIASGRIVYEKLQCASCHGTDGAGTGAAVTEFQDAAGYPMRAANLTEPWTFRGGRSSRDVFLRFRTGVDGSPMPSYLGSATEREMWDLANYVISIGRKPLWEMDAAEAAQFLKARETEKRKDPVAWGRYLVHTHGCLDCHTPLNGKGGYLEEYMLAGGQRWSLGPFGEVVSYNLTSDSTTGLGGWTDEQIKRVLTSGTRHDDSRMLPFPMPWTALANLTDGELSAIVAYLRTIPPVKNSIPKPRQLGLFPYLAAKFRMLILKEEVVLQTYAGNAGGMEGEKESSPEHGVVPKEEHP